MFSKELFQFLVELKFNNERPWFLKNKARYEAQLKKPMQALVEELLPRLKKVNRGITQGRMLRIYRDVRFAKDKSPYKTNLAAQFSRLSEAEGHKPGIYLHLEPGESFVMAGVWRPEAEDLKRIRAAIQASPRAWAPLSKMPLWGESYQRPPKGIDPGHRYLADLKRKDFLTWVEFKDKDVLGAGFAAKIEAACRRMNPLLKFLDGALGLK